MFLKSRFFFFFSSRRRHTRLQGDWSSDVCSSDLEEYGYEDHYPHWAPKPDADSAETLRRTAWEIAMAGAYGTAGESARRGVNIWPNTGGGWINGRGDDTMVMLKGYEHMVDFFTSFEWWKTEPHDELVNNGAYCLAKLSEILPPRLTNA